MKEYQIRNQLIDNLTKLISEVGHKLNKDYYEDIEIDKDDPFIGFWVSEELKRVFWLEEIDYYDTECSFFAHIDTFGSEEEYLKLTVMCRNTHLRSSYIFELYSKWFIENVCEEEMNNLIEKMEDIL